VDAGPDDNTEADGHGSETPPIVVVLTTYLASIFSGVVNGRMSQPGSRSNGPRSPALHSGCRCFVHASFTVAMATLESSVAAAVASARRSASASSSEARSANSFARLRMVLAPLLRIKFFPVHSRVKLSQPSLRCALTDNASLVLAIYEPISE
jgi:hypothetical protein